MFAALPERGIHMKPDSGAQKERIILNRRRSVYAHLFKIMYIVGEIILMNAGFILTIFLWYRNTDATFDTSFRQFLYTTSILTIFAVIYIDYLGMTHFFRKNRTDIASSSFQFVFLIIVTAAAIAFFLKWFSVFRYGLVVGSAVVFLVTVLWSILCLEFSKVIYSKGKLLILAASVEDADKLYMKVRGELKKLHIDYLGYRVLDEDIKIVHKCIKESTEILISSSISEASKAELFLYCANRDKTIYVVPQFSDLMYSKFRMIQFMDMPTFMIDSLGLTFQQRVLKRTFDVLFSLLVMVILSPVFLVISICVRLDSKGKALYSQERITRSGKVYKVYKFRTMVDAAEERFGDYQATPEDPRITRVGKFLRNTHLDELPQFYNILCGDMSVVGPRSDRPTTIHEFEENIPGYNQRLKVKAGLTGMAQIYGKYNSDPGDKLTFDVMYIKNYSFLTDIKIILQTIRTMFPDNNYLVQEDCENWEYTPKHL